MRDRDAKVVRCAIYTRKSSEEGLEQSFNSLDAQREACSAFIESQRHEGWRMVKTHYDDGGYSGGSMERPGLQKLLKDIAAQAIDVVVVYKVDRLTRSLSDFARIVETFDAHKVSFVSVTQQFNTTTSMGRLTLNVLLSFAQFEREVTGERIRDKIAASKKKGMWMGGYVPLGYRLNDRKLVIDLAGATRVRQIFRRYVALGCVRKLKAELDAKGMVSKKRVNKTGRRWGGTPYSRGALYKILQNRVYLGEITHRTHSYPGAHLPIIAQTLWDKVQAQLQASGRMRRHGLQAKEPSLLAGKLFDAVGTPLTPSHALKDGKRYRYYVQTRSDKSSGDSRGPRRLRIPAGELERIVINTTRNVIGEPQRLLDLLARRDDSAAFRKVLVLNGKRQATHLSPSNPGALRSIFLRVMERIVVHDDAMELHVRNGVLRMWLSGNAKEESMTARARPERDGRDDVAIVRVDAMFTRLGAEVRLVVPPAGGTVSRRPNRPLIKALVRAHQWHAQISTGDAQTLRAIANQAGVTPRYVSRVVRCAFLAPDITEAILDGHQPVILTLDQLLHRLPLTWPEQRRRFGFL